METVYLNINNFIEFLNDDYHNEIVMLGFKDCEIGDLSFLNESSITELYFDNCHNVDLNLIAQSNVNGLRIQNSKVIGAYSSLHSLRSLTTISLQNSYLDDFSFLKDLSADSIFLDDTNFNDLALLPDVIEYLVLDRCHIKSISLKKNYSNLNYLSLEEAKFNDLEFLAYMSNIKFLNLKGTSGKVDSTPLLPLERFDEIILPNGLVRRKNK